MAKSPQQIVTTAEGWATSHLIAAAALALAVGFILGAVIF